MGSISGVFGAFFDVIAGLFGFILSFISQILGGFGG